MQFAIFPGLGDGFDAISVTQIQLLEAISKSLEEDDEASELDEAEEVLGVILPAHKDAALPLDPGEEAFHHPPSGVSSESAPVLRRGFAAV